MSALPANSVYLIDSDVAIDIWRNFAPAIHWFRGLPRIARVLLPGYSAMEIAAGCRNRQELQRALVFLTRLDLVWLSESGSPGAFRLFASHHLAHGIGVTDALIAETALERNLALHTFNLKHYRQIDGLNIIQPYERT